MTHRGRATAIGRPGTAWIVLALVVLLAAAPTAPTDARVPEGAVASVGRPNVVLFLVDDMRADELRFLPKTRRLIGRQGVTYTRPLSPHPLCCPARAELITGQYAQNMGVKHNDGPWGGFRSLRRPHNTIGSWMDDRGYRTAFVGKYVNGYRGRWGAVRGWDRWQPLTRRIYGYWRPKFFHAGPDEGYTTRAIRRRAARAIRAFDGDPSFLYISHPAPHDMLRRFPGGSSAWGPPASERRYRDLYQRYRPAVLRKASFNEKNVADLPPDLRRAPRSRSSIIRLARARARALRSVDDSIAHLVRQLRATGQLANTYVVVSSDNGFMFGEHRIYGKNVLFDEALEVPLLARGPRLPQGVKVRRPVTLIDLPATFAKWTGATPGRSLDGLPLTNPDRRRDTILIQTGTSRSGTRGWSYRGVSTRRYLYARRAGHPGSGLLFDRARDPQQLRNRYRAPAYTSVRRALAHRSRVLAHCSGTRDCNRTFGPVPRPK